MTEQSEWCETTPQYCAPGPSDDEVMREFILDGILPILLLACLLTWAIGKVWDSKRRN